MKPEPSRVAALWFAIDMAAPTFKHESDDGHASLAEGMVARARRPSKGEILRFARMLQEYLEVAEAPEIELAVDFVPLGEFNLLCDRAGFGGSKVHLFSWFSKMWVTDDSVRVKQGPKAKPRVIYRAEDE